MMRFRHFRGLSVALLTAGAVAACAQAPTSPQAVQASNPTVAYNYRTDQELVNAKLLEGGYPEVARMIHGHPTFSEAILEAARAADGWLFHG